MVCQHDVVRRHVEDVECGVWCGVVCMGCGVDYTWWDYTWCDHMACQRSIVRPRGVVCVVCRVVCSVVRVVWNAVV